MKTDIEIARETRLKPIVEVAENLGLTEFELYGKYKAKVALVPFNAGKTGKLVLVTAMSPTPAGEGKTTVSIGLADGLNQLGKKAVLALREPSLGPVFGLKGGATGGGYAQVAPMEDINLHFTGDMHAIEAANNLIAAIMDNHIYQGNVLLIDPERIVWRRALDVNDRVLRQITVGQGSKFNGVERADGFDIAVVSEIMAVLCLATSVSDLKKRLGRMVVAYTNDDQPVTVRDLGCVDAAAILLKDALKPNLVQTLEGTPAFVHGGPFANIAHGCNSILATQAALNYGDFAVTEAGFGADLGAEKFLDIVVPELGKTPDVVVVVATVRALKFHGGVAVEELSQENLSALTKGFVNLQRHITNMQKYRIPVVVAINRFESDTQSELETLSALTKSLGVVVAVTKGFSEGGVGAKALAEAVCQAVSNKNTYLSLLAGEATVLEKLDLLIREIYGGKSAILSEAAQADMKQLMANGWDKLPVCVAKTPASFSDDAKKLGAPSDFTVTVKRLLPRLGAGFVVVQLGKILTMPGLPKHPAALDMSLSDEGMVTGLS